MSTEVHVHRDAEAAALAAAGRFVEIGQRAIDERGRFCVALSGGTTPARMYEILGGARGRTLPWGRVHIFFCDERCVPPDHTHSNYAMVHRSLLTAVGVREDHVHRINGELEPPERAAQNYDSVLRAFFGADDARSPFGSTFDLVLLGVGEDGHVASLFPGSRAVAEKQRWAVRACAPSGFDVPDRVTLTLPVINASRRVMFLVTRERKSRVVRPLLTGLGETTWPVTLVQCEGSTEWHVDEDAAGRTPHSATA